MGLLKKYLKIIEAETTGTIAPVNSKDKGDKTPEKGAKVVVDIPGQKDQIQTIDNTQGDGKIKVRNDKTGQTKVVDPGQAAVVKGSKDVAADDKANKEAAKTVSRIFDSVQYLNRLKILSGIR